MAKILIIDDDAAMVQIILGCLAEDGHTVLAATDAYTGMNMALRERPDLITLDFQMPAGDGGKVHERLRGNTNTARIPIIFVTGVEQAQLPPFARGDVSSRYLSKPIDMERLRAFVSELTGAPAPAPGPAKAERPKTSAPAAPEEPRIDGGALGGDILDLDL
ncbi:MAG: response regulator [Elusimicrobia bacterium]|nr:response regulator [Elusimicrobiota bacterium]